MKIILIILRLLFGAFLLYAGANKLYPFMDPPPPASDEAMTYFTALTITKTLTLVAIVEVLSGLSLLINKYAALMMIILMSVSVNAVLYHATIDPDTILMAAVMLILNIIMLFIYKNRYRDILRP